MMLNELGEVKVLVRSPGSAMRLHRLVAKRSGDGMSGLSSGSCLRAAVPVPITRNNSGADAMEGQYAN